MLIQKGADVNIVVESGRTPLMKAVEKGNKRLFHDTRTLKIFCRPKQIPSIYLKLICLFEKITKENKNVEIFLCTFCRL